MGRTYATNRGNNERFTLNSLEQYNRGADSNPARVKAREEVQIFKLNGFSFSIKAHALPVQMN
jgi:hypothetical protein